ncbi:glycosyl hydrolase family 28-related protein [Aquabacterium sp.]|uniref:glycosyl hydrolase family 28-related protein n=1 Tax=Aquabacterium sp. TaxID=1872578 RepID=UPI003D00EA97
MPISSQVPIIGYVANGVTKSFAFPFAILSADDLKVKVGADVVTTGFSIAGVGDRDGGSVTFTDAPASPTPIILYREVTLDRTTDYQENGDLLAIVLDDDLDRIWMALQDQLLLADRAVRAPIGETLQQLPPASERALMALAFDAAGNPIVVRGTNDGGAALALDLMDTAPGKGAALVGFQQAGSGAVATTVQSKLRESVSVKDFGAAGGGTTDDTAALQAALDYAGTIGNADVVAPADIFLFTSTLTIPSGVGLSMRGGRRGMTGFKSNVIGAPSINVANGYYQRLKDFNLFHATPGSAGTGIQIIDNDGAGSGTDPAQHLSAANVRVVGHATGIRIANESTWCSFDDVMVEQCSGAAYSVANANLTVFNRCIADACDTAFYLESTTKTILDKCTAQSCASTTSAAVNILNCDNVELNSLWTERNSFHNVHVRGTSRMTRITEMLNQGAGTGTASGRGIYVDGTASNTIIDGGWHGSNATEDITIAATTTNTVVINPRSTTTLTMTDSSTTSCRYGRGQIQFPSTPNLSSDPRTLDTYAEGTFSPTIIGTSTAGAGTYNSQVGRYTRIGDTVFFHARINLSAHTGTGNMVIGNLPFTSQNVTGLTPAVSIGLVSGLTLPVNSWLTGDIQPNSTQITLYTNSTAGGAVSSAALALDAAFVIEVSGFYKA